MLLQRENPATRTRTEVWRDAETGLPLIRSVQDVDPILDQNARDAALFCSHRVARNPAGIRHVARIPLVVWRQLEQLGIVEQGRVVDDIRFLRFLSDGDVRKLRCDNAARLA